MSGNNAGSEKKVDSDEVKVPPNFIRHIIEDDIQMSAVRSQGAGGQNVNKVSSAIHLRFDIPDSSLPEPYKSRLLHSKDKRINKDGVIVLKAQRFRSQEKNREDALERLKAIILTVTSNRKFRAAI